MPKPTDPSIGEAVERVTAFADDHDVVLLDRNVPLLRADLRALLSENAQLRERVGVLEGENAEAMREASDLAMWLFNRYYKDLLDQPQIVLLTSPAGVLTQIDNMVAGVRDRLQSAETSSARYRTALEEIKDFDGLSLKPGRIARQALDTTP